MGAEIKVKACCIIKVLRLYLSSQNMQEDPRARCGAIRSETVLKIMPQTWFLKTTLIFSVGTTSHLNHCHQLSSILDMLLLESTTASNTVTLLDVTELILPSLYFASIGPASKSSLCG